MTSVDGSANSLRFFLDSQLYFSADGWAKVVEKSLSKMKKFLFRPVKLKSFNLKINFRRKKVL